MKSAAVMMFVRRYLSGLLLLFLIIGGISKPAHAATYNFTGASMTVAECEIAYGPLVSQYCSSGTITASVTIPDELVASGYAQAYDSSVSLTVTIPHYGTINSGDTNGGGAAGDFVFDSSGQITGWRIVASFSSPDQTIYASAVSEGGFIYGSEYSAEAFDVSYGHYDENTHQFIQDQVFLGYSFSHGSWTGGPGGGGGNVAAKGMGNPANNPGGITCGNPCSLGNGNKFEEVTDYTTAGQNPLRFTRYYNSLAEDEDPFAVTLGPRWRSNYDRYLDVISPTEVTAGRADGQVLRFTETGGVWNAGSDVDISLTYDSLTSTWTLTDHNDTVETYMQFNSGEALLQKITARNGYTQTLDYNSSLELTTVTDSYGRVLTFAYNSSGLLAQVATPDALVISYTYDSSGLDPGVDDRLTSVAYNTTPVTQQVYSYVNNFDLASITDENGAVFASWTYDAEGRALTSQHGSGAELMTFAYDSETQRTVTNALGQQTVYTFTTLQGVPKITGISRTASPTVPAATQSFTYDANGYTASQTDWNGIVTNYINDTHGNPLSITEAAATPEARTTTFTYGGVANRQPATITAPRLTTGFTYDTQGNPLTRTQTDTSGGSTNGQTRVWTFTYDSMGHLLTATDPRSAVTTYTYTGNNLATVTNALGHVSEITSYTGGGLPLSLKDPNGTVTTLAYDVRNRLTSRTVSGATTTFSYDAAGNLTTMTLPDNAQLSYTYDAARRVTAVTNNLGESINYTLDAAGNITQQNIIGGTTIAKTQSAVFDSLGRMLQQIGAYNETTAYTYDANGNRTAMTDALNHTTTQGFDALNRLVGAVDPLGGATATALDAQDNLASVTDPRGLVTSYTYNGFGEVIAQASPDTGTTTYTTDALGNRVSETDARGVVTNRTFDLLNRVLTETYPASAADNVAYTYDAGNSGIGRMTGFTDKSGSTAYTYDARGNILTDKRIIGGRVYITAYTYDLADHMTSITYPDGRVVSYARDGFGRISGVSVQNKALATNITYRPFGPVSGFTFGNGIAAAFTYDLNYRLTGIASAVQGLGMGYNAVHNITAITAAGGQNQSFTYDANQRLLSAAGIYGQQAFAYDADGNRTGETENSSVTAYAYPANSNRLLSAGSKTFTYDAAGNTLAADGQRFTYDARGRLSAVGGQASANASYLHNALGERVQKDARGKTVFIYDLAGNLIAEANNGGHIEKEYIYIDSLPVAMIHQNTVYYIHTDHLGAPQKMTDIARKTVWERTSDPFGETVSIKGNPNLMNLRFPGQYFDAESGLHYNMFRSYDSKTGRYTQSDPIGLAGGLNTYSYVGQNPVNRVDPWGLETPSVSLGRPLHSPAYPRLPSLPPRPTLPPSIPCPPTLSECSVNPDFKSYPGYTPIFHCGDTGFVQANTPPNHQQQECMYNSEGRLETGACGGSPNDYDAEQHPFAHTSSDTGGIFYPTPPIFSDPAWEGGKESLTPPSR